MLYENMKKGLQREEAQDRRTSRMKTLCVNPNREMAEEEDIAILCL